MAHHAIIQIFTSQVCITGCRYDFKQRFLVNGQYGHIECPATEVKHEYLLFFPRGFIKSVSQRGRCWFVEDPPHVQPSDPSSVFSCLPLRIVEISGYCDDRVFNLLSQVRLGCLFHFGQNHRTNLLWRKSLRLSFILNAQFTHSSVVGNLEWPLPSIGLDRGVVKVPPDQSLDIEDCVLWIHGDLVLGGVSYQSFSFRESDATWGGSITVAVGDYFDLVILEYSHTGVGGSKINSNDSFRTHLVIGVSSCPWAFVCLHGLQNLL